MSLDKEVEIFWGDLDRLDDLEYIKYLVMEYNNKMLMGFGWRVKPHSNIITKHRKMFGVGFLRSLIGLGYSKFARGGGFADVSIKDKTISFYSKSGSFGKASQKDVDYIMSNAAPDWTWTYE